MSVVEDLQNARDIVARGWCSKGLMDAAGNLCAVEALNVACEWEYAIISRLSRRCEAYKALQKHLPTGPWGGEIAHYNDHPNTTHADVLNLFDKALADLGGLGA